MSLQVETSGGRIEGVDLGEVRAWLGVPYAAPPVGPLRWMPPQPHPGWSGTRDATVHGHASLQRAGSLERLAGAGGGDLGDEDCLTLGVWAPTSAGSEPLPVMVWIHGGGFTSGAGSLSWYDGSRLARRGVVVVTINYRLGVLGYLDLRGLDPTLASSGNAGLADQVAALEWVRDNIAAFGGDPGNVTVFGESAGAMSIATLMGTPTAKGLFHRAIAQSGAAHNVARPDFAAEYTERFLASVGTSDLAHLLSKPAPELLAAQVAVADSLTRERITRPDGAAAGIGLPLTPVLDGELLPTQPLDAIREGSAAEVDLVLGTTAEEWNLFGVMLSKVQDEATILRRLGRMVEDPEAMLSAYREARPDLGWNELWTQLLSDRVFRVPAARLADAQVAHRPGSVHSYLFSWRSTGFDGALGSCHGLDIPFTFGNLDAPGVALFAGGDAPEPLAEAMGDAWTAFARTGDPSLPGREWPAHDPLTRPTARIDVPWEVLDDPAGSELAAWDGIV